MFPFLFAVGRDCTLLSGSFHLEEASSKAWDHTISTHSLKGLKNLETADLFHGNLLRIWDEKFGLERLSFLSMKLGL